ncbi:hypothetical protein B7P02_15640 [Bordetella bronchiseptica]|uniref:hypothetical protein n=1 Tax=Bordetella bronchiseptica TaxID=518 RepID=UPI000D73948B|nr:hypothetical protein [Bordetella bronchiseptica]AWP59358.1 hypothetical protein B7P02_15640 [Bordetella bronchiseptica]
MLTFRAGITFAVLLLTLALIVSHVMSGQYWVAAAEAILGLAVASWTFGISSPFDDDRKLIFIGLATIGAALGVTAAVSNSGLFKQDKLAAQIELVPFYMRASAGLSGPLSPEARAIAEKGLKLCALHHYIAAGDLILEVHKAISFGPTMSLTLASYDTWIAQRPETPTCFSTFVDFAYHAPDVAGAYLHSHPILGELVKTK